MWGKVGKTLLFYAYYLNPSQKVKKAGSNYFDMSLDCGVGPDM